MPLAYPMRHSLLIGSPVAGLFAFVLAGCSSGVSSSPLGPLRDGGALKDGEGSLGKEGGKTKAKDDGGGLMSDDGGSIADDDGGDAIADADNTITVDGQVVSVAASMLDRTPASSVAVASLSDLVTANNAFAIDLYAQFSAGAASTNLLLSPLSASIALTMTYAGAEGTTATQMASVLHYGSADATTVFEGQNALIQTLEARASTALSVATRMAAANGLTAPSASNYQIQIVNSVWGESKYTWNAPFLVILAENYGTGVYLEDFEANFEGARMLINAWVSSETADKINNLLPAGSLDNGTRMVLVNALHLKFPWSNPFNAAVTGPASFTTGDNTTVSTPFMYQTGTLAYVDDGDAQIVGLPLANQELAVVIALPHGDLATYEAGLTATSAGIAMPAGTAVVQLSVPKVSFTSPSSSLATALKAMGMPVAFDSGNADFKGLCTQPPDGFNLFITDVFQKATIDMQETGIEAAAAAAVIIGADSSVALPPPMPIPMNVNRPYVLSIVDVATGALLFLGHIVDPTEAGGP